MSDQQLEDDSQPPSDEEMAKIEEQRRQSRIALNKLHPANRLRLMSGQPFLKEDNKE